MRVLKEIPEIEGWCLTVGDRKVCLPPVRQRDKPGRDRRDTEEDRDRLRCMAHNEDHHRERFEDEEGIPQAEVIRMNEILFSYLPKNCPNCGTRLREYRRDRKLVRTLSGEFTAVHKIMICTKGKKEYGTERLFE